MRANSILISLIRELDTPRIVTSSSFHVAFASRLSFSGNIRKQRTYIIQRADIQYLWIIR